MATELLRPYVYLRSVFRKEMVFMQMEIKVEVVSPDLLIVHLH